MKELLFPESVSPNPLLRRSLWLLLACLWGLWRPGLQAQTDTTENLGPTVNSPHEELLPVITPDGSRLYFARKFHPENYAGAEDSQDIWYADYDPKTGGWLPAVHMGRDINSEQINGIGAISPDGNSILVRGAWKDGTYEPVGFSLRHRTGAGWSEPMTLEVEGLTAMAKGLFMGGTLAPSGRVLLLYFSEKENDDKNDLYVSLLQDDGTWSRPVSLGRDINTAHSEAAPFMAADNRTLYFTSDRPGGQGGYDIYKARRLDTTWLKWSKPVNLGPPINSDAFDAYYSVPAKGDYAYMVSGSGGQGGSDLVRVPLSRQQAPDPVVLLSGLITDKRTGLPSSARISYTDLETGETGSARADADGFYQLIIPAGSRYAIEITAEGYIAASYQIDLRRDKAYDERERNVTIDPEPEGNILTTLYFDTGRIRIKPESQGELDLVLTMLQRHPNLHISLHGHADIVGSYDRNYELSINRARMVRAYLVARGISPLRISIIGYANFFPYARNNSALGRSLNRRVDVHVLSLK